MTTRNLGVDHVPVAMVGALKDPTTYREEIQSAELWKWRDAMRSEIDFLKKNGKWKLIIRPPGLKLLHSKWVFKTKKHVDGTLERFRELVFPPTT